MSRRVLPDRPPDFNAGKRLIVDEDRAQAALLEFDVVRQTLTDNPSFGLKGLLIAQDR
jgi:hypothetical protein